MLKHLAILSLTVSLLFAAFVLGRVTAEPDVIYIPAKPIIREIPKQFNPATLPQTRKT